MDKSERTKATILDAAIVAFADLGYHKASTADISKRAGIAKGSIFYHYPTKKDLYLACVSHGSDLMIQELFANEAIMAIPDIFDKIIAFGRAKSVFLLANPSIFKVITEAFALSREPGFEDIARLMQSGRLEVWPYWSEHVDTTCFKPGFDPKEIMEYIYLSMGTLTEKLAAHYDADKPPSQAEMEQTFEQLERYIGFMKHGVYSS